MIVLKVADYCHDCTYFEPITDDKRVTLYGENMFTGERTERIAGDLVIRCEHCEKCKTIENYVREKLKK